MINFYSITLEAHDLYDPVSGMPNSKVVKHPAQLYFNRYGEERPITFREGDCVDVVLTDRSKYLILFENGKWCSCQFVSRNNNLRRSIDEVYLVTRYGPYDSLDEALDDLVSKRNYLNLN